MGKTVFYSLQVKHILRLLKVTAWYLRAEWILVWTPQTETNMHTWNSFVFTVQFLLWSMGFLLVLSFGTSSYLVATRSMTRDYLVPEQLKREVCMPAHIHKAQSNTLNVMEITLGLPFASWHSHYTMGGTSCYQRSLFRMHASFWCHPACSGGMTWYLRLCTDPEDYFTGTKRVI